MMPQICPEHEHFCLQLPVAQSGVMALSRCYQHHSLCVSGTYSPLVIKARTPCFLWLMFACTSLRLTFSQLSTGLSHRLGQVNGTELWAGTGRNSCLAKEIQRTWPVYS